MREVICYDKDFITGKTHTVKKHKPSSMAKGKVKVQLFDENGGLIKEANTENIIYDWIKPFAFKNAYEVNFGIGTYGNYQTKTTITESSDGLECYSKYLMLFNGDHEDTNPKNALIKDTLVGYAGRYLNYSGTSATQGSYNSAESTVGIDDKGNLVYHMVYDFPTNAGNGTITGVGMGSYTSSTEPDIYRLYGTTFGSYSYVLNKYCSGIWSSHDWHTFAGLMCNRSETTYSLRVLNKMADEFRQFGSSSMSYSGSFYPTEYGTTSLYGYASYDMEARKGHICYNYSGESFRFGITKGTGVEPNMYPVYVNFRRLNEDGKVTTHKRELKENFKRFFDIKDSITTSSSSAISGYSMFTIAKNGNTLYYLRTISNNTSIFNSSTNKSWILEFDQEGYLVNSQDLTGTKINGRYAKWIKYGDKDILLTTTEVSGSCTHALVCDNGSYEIVPIENFNFVGGDKTTCKQIANTMNIDYFIGNMNREVIGFADDGKYQRHCFENGYRKLSSYTKLPSPIIKTNTNTMKVQYDIVIEDINPYDYIDYQVRG